VVEEHLPRPKRKLVDGVSLKGVADIEVGVAVVERREVGVLILLRSFAAAPSGRILIVEEVGPDIVEVSC